MADCFRPWLLSEPSATVFIYTLQLGCTSLERLSLCIVFRFASFFFTEASAQEHTM